MISEHDAGRQDPGRSPRGHRIGADGQLLTLPELAEQLQLSEKTLRRMIASGRLPCVRLGRQLRFLPGDVFRWLEARKE
jgi:excisionase family DNA binding protein